MILAYVKISIMSEIRRIDMLDRKNKIQINKWFTIHMLDPIMRKVLVLASSIYQLQSHSF